MVLLILSGIVFLSACSNNAIVSNGDFTLFEDGTILVHENNFVIGEEYKDDVKNVYYDETVTIIPENSFKNCINLKNIYIPSGVTSIGINAFYNTAYFNDKDNWNEEVLFINNHLIYADRYISGKYDIPEDTITIANGAFFGCCYLEEVNIPSSVNAIGKSAFEYCTRLKYVGIPSDLKNIGDNAFYKTEYESLETNDDLIEESTTVAEEKTTEEVTEKETFTQKEETEIKTTAKYVNEETTRNVEKPTQKSKKVTQNSIVDFFEDILVTTNADDSNADDNLKEFSLPINGGLKTENGNDISLKIYAPTGNLSVYLRIYDDNGNVAGTIFLRPGRSSTLNLSQGKYTIKAAYGEHWYGTYNLFGSQDAYYNQLLNGSEEIFVFESGYSYTLRLQSSTNGNVGSKNIGGPESMR